MFDIGFSEIFVIAVVALLVLGPERLPKAARFAGLWVRRARAQWYSVKSELENELADEELRRSLRQTQADLREAQESLRNQIHDSRDTVQRELREAERSVESLNEAPASEPTAEPTALPAATATTQDDERR
ncbi:Sec-independent protein translocase protein TatB [Lysobacter sp. cf310]|uniref:Sec-independent protein translocase protein TatB n=1 Tax=Lysobacter sp. cf310 TaxID=1761790 RepID=UPI0008E5A446|nr:Sec-independent protein translocase protein TatB [Lysobacter sp. cf310]SFL07287.1 sec-independent protein translocase protein TatB [Lysobacter sp. cf310]